MDAAKYFPLIWAALWRKPLRTIFTILSLVVAFTLFGMLQGVNAGMTHLFELAADNRIIVNPRFFSNPMPIAYKQKIEEIPGVEMVAPVAYLNGYYQDPKNYFFISATDEAYFSINFELTATQQQISRLRNTPTGFIANSTFADRLGIKVGDIVPIKGNQTKADGSRDWSMELLAIIENTSFPDGQYSIGNYEYFNEERGDRRNTSQQYFVRIEDHADADKISQSIDDMFANSSVPTRSQSEQANVQAGFTNFFGDMNFFVNAIVGSVLVVLLLLTANTMIQSVQERTPELAVLKTLGFSDNQVMILVLAESAIQCLLGAVVGLALSVAFIPLLQGALQAPAPMFIVPPEVLAAGLAVALSVAFLSAIVPAKRAQKLEIVDAMAGR